MTDGLAIDRSLIQDPPAKERVTDKPASLIVDIDAAIALGLDWQIVCEYDLDPMLPGGRLTLRRRYRFTAWAQVDKAEMREALANLELQREKRARAHNAIESVR